MKQILGAFRRTSFGTVAALFLLAVVGVALPPRDASAAGLLYRSLELTSSQPSGVETTGAGGVASNPGDAANGDEVGHTYIFQGRSTYNLEALNFQYCTTAFGYLDFAPDNQSSACTLPTGFDYTLTGTADIKVYESTGGVWPNLTWEATGQDYDAAADATDPTFAFNITPTGGAGTGTPVTAAKYIKVVFTPDASNYFTNPSTEGTFFAHLETYDDATDVATGAHVDEGTVASSTSDTIAINTRVQEVLKFSVEGEDQEVPNGPSVTEASGTCDPLTGNGLVRMGNRTNSDSLASDRTYDAYSYFRLATNSSKGAKVLYAGETLQSTAGDSITPLGTAATAANAGEEQFGLAFAQDFTDVAYENDVQPNADENSTTDNDLAAVDIYEDGAVGLNGSNEANGFYAFDTSSNGVPALLASSASVVKCDTGVVRYIANISTDTPAGLYSTKISYIAVPSY